MTADLLLRDWRPEPKLVVPSHAIDRARFPAVDAHNHLGRWLSAWVGDDPDAWTVPDVADLLTLMETVNLRAIVNLDGRWGAELEENLERYDRAHPGRFATFCHVDWEAAVASGDLGATAAARERMRRNIDLWWPHLEAGAEAILITASGCGAVVCAVSMRLST